jgi:probable HAF family extracellular repeat protein
MRNIFGKGFSAALLAMVSALAYGQTNPSFASFAYPDAIRTTAYDVNDHGQIVGVYADQQGFQHAFLRQPDGSFQTFNVTDIVDGNSVVRRTRATGINNSGTIVGFYSLPLGQIDIGGCSLQSGTRLAQCPFLTVLRGFLRTPDGVITPLDFPDSSGSVVPVMTTPRSINDRGDIVGYYSVFDHWAVDPNTNRFFAVYSGDHGFVRDKITGFSTLDYPGAFSTDVNGINNRGELAGFTQLDAASLADSNAYVYEHGSFIDLFTFVADTAGCGGSGSHINDQGEMVGLCFAITSSGTSIHSFFRDKSGLITSIDVPGAVNTIVESVNNRAAIVGAYDVSVPPGGTKTYAFVLQR